MTGEWTAANRLLNLKKSQVVIFPLREVSEVSFTSRGEGNIHG